MLIWLFKIISLTKVTKTLKIMGITIKTKNYRGLDCNYNGLFSLRYEILKKIDFYLLS